MVILKQMMKKQLFEKIKLGETYGFEMCLMGVIFNGFKGGKDFGNKMKLRG